jgi:carbamoyl-phosphate synthase large subunit
VNLIDECINILTGSSMSVGLPRTQTFYTVKQPVFSTGKLEGVDPVPAPEMKSTGEVMAIGNTADEAMAKAVLWNEHLAGNAGQREFFIDDCKDKEKWIEMIRNFGFSAVTETEDRPFSEWIKQQKGGIFVSPGRLGQSVEKRKMASLAHIAVVTEMETLEAWLSGLKQERTKPASLQDWLKHHKKEVVT